MDSDVFVMLIVECRYSVVFHGPAAQHIGAWFVALCFFITLPRNGWGQGLTLFPGHCVYRRIGDNTESWDVANSLLNCKLLRLVFQKTSQSINLNRKKSVWVSIKCQTQQRRKIFILLNSNEKQYLTQYLLLCAMHWKVQFHYAQQLGSWHHLKQSVNTCTDNLPKTNKGEAYWTQDECL